MVIIEAPIFTKTVLTLLSEEEYRFLQVDLLGNPDAGKVIPGSDWLTKASMVGKGTWETWRRKGHLLLV